MRRPVTIARYLDVTEAQLARVRLGGEDIESFVIEGSGFNPLLTGATGGVQLQVRERDLDRAREILAETPPEVEDDPEPAVGGERVVRCPRCELEYCYHERVRAAGQAIGPLIVLVQVFASSVTAKRWRCRKCEHVWDDPGEGPARMTRLEPGDPRPVFRLRRGRGGTGLFLGLILGFVGAVVTASLIGRIEDDLGRMAALIGYAALFFGVPVLGWRVGKAVQSDVCSEPSCRAPLLRGAEECSGCKGTIAGTITSAPEHFAAAADVRREIAASRKVELPRKKRLAEPAASAP
ncbi:MAG: hypothetical protein ABI134_24320 [Byssovorax sp.]